MTYIDRQFEDAVRLTLETGHKKSDRTGTGTRSKFGVVMRYDLRGTVVPLITTKFTSFRLIMTELLWLLSGSTNIKTLVDQDCHIWDEWAKDNGDLGPVYGAQWRAWDGKPKTIVNANPEWHDGKQMGFSGEVLCEKHDQIADAIRLLREDPDSRRIIVSAWNVGYLKDMALMPCHAFFQFYSRELRWDERLHMLAAKGVKVNGLTSDEIEALFVSHEIAPRALSLQITQRSADSALGVPFNLASYSMLAHMIAAQTNHVAEELLWVGNDFHIYSNHVEQVELMLSRDVRKFPTVLINSNVKDIDSYTLGDFALVGYDPHPAIKAPVAV